MNKIAVIYWTMTGNTQLMAEEIVNGVKGKGAEADIFQVSEFDLKNLDSYQAIALGCPSMGVEVLEESEFQPFFDDIKTKLSGKKVSLFGSYDWGDGEWMRNWEAECLANNIELIGEPVICKLSPDEEAVIECQALGADLVG